MKFIVLILFNIFLIVTAQVQPFDLTGCIRTGLITDRNGNVVKGLCEINTGKVSYPNGHTYANGVASCAKYGMNLILAEDQYVHASLMNYVKKFFINTCSTSWSKGCGIYINGQKNVTDGKWYATINGQQKIMDVSSYNFISNTNASFHDPGNCMAIKYQNSVFGETPWNCGSSFIPFCEYNNTYVPSPPCNTTNVGKRYFNLAACASIGTIRDNCGNVVKGACELDPKAVVTYDDAIQSCRNVGMDLFTVDSPDVASSFTQYIFGRYGKHVCGSVWSPNCGVWIGGKQVNGIWQAVKDWSTVNLNTQNYKFTTSQNPGDCMVLKNNNGFGVMAYNCSQVFGAMCEFDSKV